MKKKEKKEKRKGETRRWEKTNHCRSKQKLNDNVETNILKGLKKRKRIFKFKLDRAIERF